MQNHNGQEKNLLSYLWSRIGRVRGGMLLAVLRCLAVAPCPWLFKTIIDDHVKNGNIPGILLVSAGFTSLLILHYIFGVAGAKSIAAGLAGMMLEMRGNIFQKLQLLSFTYLDRKKSGELLAKYAFDTQKIEMSLMQILNQFIPNFMYGLAVAVILCFLHWQLSLIILLILPIFTVFRFYFMKRIQRSNAVNRQAQETLHGTASEYISALRLVRSFAAEDTVQEHLDRTSTRFADSRVEMVRINSLFGTFMYVSSQFMFLVVVAGASIFVISQGLSLGTLLAFVTGLPVVMMPFQMFGALSQDYFQGAESYRSIKELLETPHIEQWRGTKQLPALSGEVCFKNVVFAYPGSRAAALNNFSLTIRPGEHVALAGHSGAGKSTAANLILGLYRPDAGAITVDGIPQDQLDMSWFRRQTALVMQETLLLSGTVLENLLFARMDASEAEVWEACRQANAEEFILRLPDGYQTLLGERGVNLSGGQKQRISIARALLRKPRILIFDEATSSLDYESEHLVQQALGRLAAGRTVVTIAHRVSTIRNAGRIIVLRRGELVEEGSFAQLAEKGTYFSGLQWTSAPAPAGEKPCPA